MTFAVGVGIILAMMGLNLFVLWALNEDWIKRRYAKRKEKRKAVLRNKK